MRLNTGRLMLAVGLIASAGLVTETGGWWGLALGVTQGALAAAILLRPRSPWPPAWTVLAAFPAPLAAARHWTARLPGACHCARLTHPPPGLMSLTGLTVLVEVALLGLALVVVAATRTVEVEQSPS